MNKQEYWLRKSKTKERIIFGFFEVSFLNTLSLNTLSIYGIFFAAQRYFVIFASRQGAFCSFTFSFLFRRIDISGGPSRGASTGVSPPRRAHSFKKREKNAAVVRETEILIEAQIYRSHGRGGKSSHRCLFASS